MCPILLWRRHFGVKALARRSGRKWPSASTKVALWHCARVCWPSALPHLQISFLVEPMTQKYRGKMGFQFVDPIRLAVVSLDVPETRPNTVWKCWRVVRIQFRNQIHRFTPIVRRIPKFGLNDTLTVFLAIKNLREIATSGYFHRILARDEGKTWRRFSLLAYLAF